MQYDVLDALTLVKSLGVNYPIISMIECTPTRLITLVVSEHQLKAACGILENFGAPLIGEFMTPSQISQVLCETNSECVLFPFSPTRKGKELVRFIAAAVQMGSIGNMKLRALPVLISDTEIQGCDIDNLFVIYLRGDLSAIHISLNEIVPPDEQLEVVFDKIRDHLTIKNTEEKALMISACFLYPYLKKEGKVHKFMQMLEIASALVEQEDNNRDPYEAAELFIEELYLWQERTQFQDVYPLPNLEMSIVSRIDNILLYSDRYIYVKDKLFEQICQALLSIFSADVLKAALTEAGIMYPESAKTYTAKVGYRNIAGEYKRERMIRFRREKLNRAGDMDFVELCQNQKGGQGSAD